MSERDARDTLTLHARLLLFTHYCRTHDKAVLMGEEDKFSED
jgi:hypothetical protein